MLSSLQILCKWCNSRTFERNKGRVVLSAVIATLAEERKECQPQKLQLLLKIVKIHKTHVQNLFESSHLQNIFMLYQYTDINQKQYSSIL